MFTREFTHATTASDSSQLVKLLNKIMFNLIDQYSEKVAEVRPSPLIRVTFLRPPISLVS